MMEVQQQQPQQQPQLNGDLEAAVNLSTVANSLKAQEPVKPTLQVNGDALVVENGNVSPHSQLLLQVPYLS